MLKNALASMRHRKDSVAITGMCAFAKPEIYELLDAEGYAHAIRLPTNAVLQEQIAHLLTRSVERPPKEARVFHASFSYQAATWSKARP